MCVYVFIALNYIRPGQVSPQNWHCQLFSPWQGCWEEGQPQIPRNSSHKTLPGARQALGTPGHLQSLQTVPSQVALGASR